MKKIQVVKFVGLMNGIKNCGITYMGFDHEQDREAPKHVDE